MAQGMRTPALTPAPSPAPAPAEDPIPTPTTTAKTADDQFLRPHPIGVRDARRHLGALVHVVAANGVEFDGTLRAADGRTLTVERESEAGTMTHAVAVADVKALQVWR